ncbi:MAG TPA: non-canonical purine NTP pyrophosphatase [Candidatus Saccharimonadales bacterium]|nr:non-canonical purine NTP pyrophosphatase [Candidatus Saccharimonadales bacterium]
MISVLFATGNADKLRSARLVCAEFGIEITQQLLDVAEIQAEDGEAVVRDKAAKAFALLKKPVIVSDDSWVIPALNGFPGPYMKSINEWFTPEDLFRLTKPLENREIILRQYAVFQDEHGQHLFALDIAGTMLRVPRTLSGKPNETLVTFDGKRSVAEFHAEDKSPLEGRQTVWHELAPWLKNYFAK